jgi:hypothetical protein
MVVVPVTVVATVAFLMLLEAYQGIKEVRKMKAEVEAEDNDGVIRIPLGQLGGMGMVGGRPITQADVDRARVAMGHPAPQGDEKKAEYEPNKGAYI